MNMPSDEYNRMIDLVRNWNGTQEGLQKIYDDIYYSYDDGRDMIRRLDSYQSKWVMDLH